MTTARDLCLAPEGWEQLGSAPLSPALLQGHLSAPKKPATGSPAGAKDRGTHPEGSRRSPDRCPKGMLCHSLASLKSPKLALLTPIHKGKGARGGRRVRIALQGKPRASPAPFPPRPVPIENVTPPAATQAAPQGSPNRTRAPETRRIHEDGFADGTRRGSGAGSSSPRCPPRPRPSRWK